MKKELHGIEVILWVFIFCPEAPKPVCPICSEEYVQASEITDSNIPHSYHYLLTFFFSKDLLVFTPPTLLLPPRLPSLQFLISPHPSVCFPSLVAFQLGLNLMIDPLYLLTSPSVYLQSIFLLPILHTP